MTKGVTIRCSEKPGGDLVCLANGTPIPRVRSVDWHVDFDTMLPTAKIEVIPDMIEVDAQGYPLSCRHDGKEYMLVPRDHWERVQRRLDELREGENA